MTAPDPQQPPQHQQRDQHVQHSEDPGHATSLADLAPWLLEQIDADARIARAVTDATRTGAVLPGGRVPSGQWSAYHGTVADHPDLLPLFVEPDVRRPADATSPFAAEHIAAWDPERVLAECEAKRQLVQDVFQYEAKIDGEWGCCHGADAIQAGLCPETPVDEIQALRLLAVPYAGRPGYREEWRP